MILRRYLIREVLGSTLAVTGLLTFIMIGGRLIRYFGVAAQGKMDVSVLFLVVAYRLPDFLTLILPLGFFIGLMLVFGRLYVDHEMAVLNSSGVSHGQLARLLTPIVAVLIAFQAALTLYLAPWGNRQFDNLLMAQAVRGGFDLVKPGEFVSSGQYTIYASSFTPDHKDLQDIFFYQRASKADKPDVMILAKRARRIVDPEGKSSIVDLQQGRRYEIRPGMARYSQSEFDYYRLRITHDAVDEVENSRLEVVSTARLRQRWAEAPVRAELGWRVSMPLVLAVAVLLTIPLSRVNPRQGRYLRLFPAILLFASCVIALMAVKTRISKEKLDSAAYAMVLLAYAGFALFLIYKDQLLLWVSSRRAGVAK